VRSGENNFNYFPKHKLTKLANFVQFICMLLFCLEDWGLGLLGPLGYATDSQYILRATADTAIARLSHRNSVRLSVCLSHGWISQKTMQGYWIT